MKTGKIIGIILIAAVAIALIGLALKVVSGLFSLMGGLINAVLGLAVIIALVVIVVWMFRYAAKNNKK